MSKKDRSDSAHMQSKLAQAALTEILPPDICPLEDSEMPFWRTIISARHEWTEIDKIHAANLARTFQKIEENTSQLKYEGDVLENARGTPVMNPRFTVLEQLTRRAAALSQKLHVHASATIGKPDQQPKKNREFAKVASAFEDMDDQLIARPN